jgi:outer membrane lipoprotein-sorting protein
LIALFFVLLVFLPESGLGEENLQSVIGRMQSKRAVAIPYQETRYLSLMSEKWTGSGNFYALPPDTMIKAQSSPEKELMAIKGPDLYYFNQKTGQKHHATVSEEASLMAHISLFKSLMNGELEALQQHYQFNFSTRPAAWLVTLTPKKASESETGFQVIMQGIAGQSANKLELIMTDGDRIEYRLDTAHESPAIKLKIQQLVDLLGAQ